MERTTRLKWMENILQCMLGAVVCVHRLLSCLYFPLSSFHPLFLDSLCLLTTFYPSSSFSVFLCPLTSLSSLFLLSSPSLLSVVWLCYFLFHASSSPLLPTPPSPFPPSFLPSPPLLIFLFFLLHPLSGMQSCDLVSKNTHSCSGTDSLTHTHTLKLVVHWATHNAPWEDRSGVCVTWRVQLIRGTFIPSAFRRWLPGSCAHCSEVLHLCGDKRISVWSTEDAQSRFCPWRTKKVRNYFQREEEMCRTL